MASVRLKKGHAYVVYWDSATKRNRMASLSLFAGQPVRTLKQAEPILRRWIKERKQQASGPQGVSGFLALYRDYASTRTTESTQKGDNQRMGAFEASLTAQGVRWVAGIKQRHMEVFLRSLTCAPRTRNMYLTLIKTILSYAMHRGFLGSHPAAFIKAEPVYNPKPMRALTDEEIDVIRRSFPEPVRSFCLVALYSGLRRSDLIHLAWADVDMKAGTITVRPKPEVGYSPKSIRYRSGFDVIPILPDLRAVLERLPRTGLWVFSHRTGRPLHRPPTWSIYISRLFREHGIKASLHTLRHTFITRLAKARVSPMALRVIARHSALSTTLRYTHLTTDDLKDELKRAAPTFGTAGRG